MTKETKPKKMKLFTDDQVDAAIVRLARDVGKLQDRIHILGVSIAKVWHDEGFKVRKEPEKAHAVAMKAAQRFTDLMNASPYHGKAFANWVALFNEMQWSEKGSKFYTHQDNSVLTGRDFAHMRDNPFWEVSPPPAPKPLTNDAIVGMLNAILDKQKKHSKKPVEGDDFSTAGNDFIREAIKAFAG